jgi:hypothetical protein
MAAAATETTASTTDRTNEVEPSMSDRRRLNTGELSRALALNRYRRQQQGELDDAHTRGKQPPPSATTRLSSAVLGLWGALTGVAPHVLHHVGPLAGAALLAGTGGRLLFGVIAVVVSIPFLLRLYRRFRTWTAPAIAVTVMAVMYTVSSLVIGPAISGDAGTETTEEQHDEHGH